MVDKEKLVLSQFARGANRSRQFVLPRRANHPLSGRFAMMLPVLLLSSFVLAPQIARAQAQVTGVQTQQSTSSSSQSSQQPLETRRSLESRRLQTRQRRESAAVTETYTHRWDVFLGGSYMRFRPGPSLHNSGVAGWTFGATRYFTPRFGITADVRGLYGNNSLGPTNGGGYNTYNASFSVFPFTIGPQYRFYGSSKWSISGAAQAGAVYGYFDANTNGIPPQLVGFYPASIVGGGILSVDADYNLSPALAVRFAPHILFDDFGGNFDHNQGLLVGLVYRLGRQ
jgi:hypothetical protein